MKITKKFRNNPIPAMFSQRSISGLPLICSTTRTMANPPAVIHKATFVPARRRIKGARNPREKVPKA